MLRFCSAWRWVQCYCQNYKSDIPRSWLQWWNTTAHFRRRLYNLEQDSCRKRTPWDYVEISSQSSYYTLPRFLRNYVFCIPFLEVNQNSSVELSPTGCSFGWFVLKFSGWRQDETTTMSWKAVFLPPQVYQNSGRNGCSFRAVCNEAGYVTSQGWAFGPRKSQILSLWTTNHFGVYLAYLGFDDDSSMKAIKITSTLVLLLQKDFITGSRLPIAMSSTALWLVPQIRQGLLRTCSWENSDVYSPTITPKMGVKDIELRGGENTGI